MKPISIAFPFWARVVLLAGVLCIVVGAGLFANRYFRQPVTLSLAVGSLDGEAGRAASIVAAHLARKQSHIRLRIIKMGNVQEAAATLAAGKADLAVVRADVGDLSHGRSVALLGHAVLMLATPPGSAISSVADLQGRKVGVVGGDVNRTIVDVLTQQYDLATAKVTFENIDPADARRAIQSGGVAALLLVGPLNEKYLSYVKGLFGGSPATAPMIVPIDSAAAIADANGAYETFDIPRGTLRGAPPVPAHDVTTLRTGFYLVADKKLHTGQIADLTKEVISARKDLVDEQPVLAGIAAADTDPDAFIPVHPGAAEYYDGTQQSFMDKYSNEIFLTPMILGAFASIFAGAWRFLGIRQDRSADQTLQTLHGLPVRIRRVQDTSELALLEDEVDELLGKQMARAVKGDEHALKIATLVSAGHRLDNLIHHRRATLTSAARSHDNSVRSEPQDVSNR